ncbi:MAG TPA: hemerythrin domain-containing protein [Burkholderiaceae bacterium]|nr:hemerythrin domain-containing protein [Burkholderiaceae bacterium]HMX11171.1 hemerythrin domain-containing protein [Burkholderiaceae bacterium]HMY98239.1 hemerythrin domain-containing protein [Burkholderiaceae bacterium]HNB45926.1 hemerythrin domain-containing protein [Burkholderiaceae bacterium]HNG79306.1 hemerythrin domain-containing protein [Burkholderiaceae bacterium]
MSTTPIESTALSAFEALDSCHRDVLKTLDDLASLIDHLGDNGPDETAQALAVGIIKFFNENSRQHHLDEERTVFPALLASDDTELVQHVQRLQQDHGWLEEDWLELEPQLEAISKGYSWYQIDGLRAALPVFKALYLDHIDLEERLIYPEAKKRMAAPANPGSGRESAASRRAASV